MMVESFLYEKETGCEQCPSIIVKRTILADLSTKTNRSYIRGVGASREEIIEYKGMSMRNGNYRVKRVGAFGSGSRLGQAAQAIGSIALPGNISPYRSPIRSGIARALTPGGGGGGRRRGPGGGTSRCPEGYQYGGRFTDNRLSTCGAKLFDLPSPLGRAIGAIRRALRGPRGIQPDEVQGDPIRGSRVQGGVTTTRAPQIPRVSPKTNAVARDKAVGEIIKGMETVDDDVARLIRRDGFVLEPVVSPAVLRTIPDNRDMEDATYVMRLRSVDNFGGEELGMLSNTGVTNLTYVLNNGGTVEVKKVRKLTVGERRKLGRTVNKAIKTDNSSDPAARAKYLVNETGDGMSYTEKLPKGQTLADSFKKKAKKARKASAPKPTGSEDVTNVDEAAAIIRKGGSLSQISPSVLQEALRRVNLFKRQGGNYTSSSGKSYGLKRSSKPNDHINHGFSAEVQKFLGIDAPDYGIVGSGPKKNLLIESPESVIDGGKLSTDTDLSTVNVDTMAALMVSDLVSDVTDRKRNSIALVRKGDTTSIVPLFAQSELQDLSDLKIRERTKAAIRNFQSVNSAGLYSKYYRELKDEQKRQMQQQVFRLLEKAREFNFTRYRDRLYRDGQLTDGEKTHLNIVTTIIENRIDVLQNQREQIVRALGGNK